MADVVVRQEEGVQEVVEKISLASTLEAPEEEVAKVETQEEVVAKAEEKVEEKIEEAKSSGASTEEINELRAMLRELRNDNISLKARLAAAERVQKGDFGTEGKTEEPSDLEKYQEQFQKAAQRDFSELLALMEVNPKYDDLYEVCSKENFDDVFEKVARYRSENNGTEFQLEYVKAKAEVWSLANPYKYMYELIKEFHPAYTQKKEKQEEKETTPPKKEEVSAKEILKKTPVTAPGSVASMGGGDETKGGWTAEKIDQMPESKLHEVPKDIYKKWLAGELD